MSERGYLAFGMLEVGDSFRFAPGWPPRTPPVDAPVFTKSGKRHYVTQEGHQFNTGPGTAVALVKEKTQ